MDISLFEWYLYDVVTAVLKNPRYAGRRVVVYLDNARIHKSDSIDETCRKLGVCLVYGAQYSPFLQPIEMLFNEVKQRLKQIQPRYTR